MPYAGSHSLGNHLGKRSELSGLRAFVNEKQRCVIALRTDKYYLLGMAAQKTFQIDGQSISPVHSPEDRLHAILDVIRSAQSDISMFSYIFADDQSGREVRDALVDAAQRGVNVRLLVDDFGSGSTEASFFDPLKAQGGEMHQFSARWNWGYFIRNHQKILIADANRSVVGGFNISDDYFGRSGENSWEDFGILVEGDCAARLSIFVEEVFDLARDGGKGIKFGQLRRIIRKWHHRGRDVSWQVGGPTNRISPWARHLKNDLERGQRLDMVCAYFFPTNSILRRISRVTRKGGGGKLIMAGKTDNGATIGAARSLYRYLLKRSARIFEFSPRPLHMKLLVIDNVSYIGSSNLDVRSLFINMEIMLRVEDADLAEYLRGVIADMAAQSEEQTPQLHSERASLLRRIKWALSYLLVNSIDYTIGQRIRFNLVKNK